MLSYLQSALVVVGCIAAVLYALRLLDRRLDALPRKRANGVNGLQLSILGTIYAVSLGFMLSDAWLAYQTASADVREEAGAASSLYRLAAVLPASCADPVRGAVQDYAVAVVDTEWPSMANSAPVWQGERSLNLMSILSRDCAAPALSISDRQTIVAAISTLQMRRAARIEDYESRLPGMMWAVLIVGGISVIASSCLLANEKRSTHCFHVISLTALIALALLTIADLDRPFEGATHVAPASFRAVRQ
jgi:hypothetical protein